MRHETAFRAVLTAALLLAAATSIALIAEPEEYSISVGDLTVSGDLARWVDIDEYAGTATITYTGSGTDIGWYVMDADASAYVEVSDGVYEKRSCELAAEGGTLTLSEPGTYVVELWVEGDLVRTGTVVLDGEVSRTFVWTDGLPTPFSYHTYSVTFTYTYSDYASYRCDTDQVRHVSSGLDTARFAVVDDSMYELESLLRAEYESVGGTVGGQDYADFLLSFVQVCFSYPDTITSTGDGTAVYDSAGYGDLYLYGEKEYWAYPMETIHMGMGDCEDTSFLAAALFSAAGYDAGVVALTNHMVAYVALDDFVPRFTGYSNVALSAKTLTSTGQNIFFCETTTDRFVCVGYVMTDVAEELSASDLVVYPVRGAES